MLYYYTIYFVDDAATTEIYTLSLHDALPIFQAAGRRCHRSLRCVVVVLVPVRPPDRVVRARPPGAAPTARQPQRSEEHTSELQSQFHLVCRLLLEKKKTTHYFDLVIGKILTS